MKPTHISRKTTSIPSLALLTALGISSPLFAAPQLDGILGAEENYTTLAIQQIESSWGNDKNLTKIAALQDEKDLVVFVGGIATDNAILLFIDSKADGPSTISSDQITSGGEEGHINNLGPSGEATGLTFEDGFQPDFAIRIYCNPDATEAHINLYDLQTGARTYIGNSADNLITPASGPIKQIYTHWADAEFPYDDANTGAEIRLSLSSLGVPIGLDQTIKLSAILVNENSNYAANQVLGSLPETFGEIQGNINNIDFNLIDGTQTLSFEVDNSGDGSGVSDNDGLHDEAETNTGIYVSETDTGTNPFNADSDDDGFSDFDEVYGNTPLGFPTDPNHYTPTDLVVAGGFFDASWEPEGTPETTATRRGQAMGEEQHTFDLQHHFTTANQNIEYKFTNATAWDAEDHRDWGQSSAEGTLQIGGGNISNHIGASGIYRFTTNLFNMTHSLERITFDSYEDFAEAYGLTGGESADDDFDGLSNYDEFIANTDPTNSDTNGNGILDGADPTPLTQSRTIVFRVNMNVQIAQGNFDPESDEVVVKIFSGILNGTEDIPLSDADEDGIYLSEPITVDGFEGAEFGSFKFFNLAENAPNSGYEFGFDRNFELGAAFVQQIVPEPTAYFSDDETLPNTYDSWIAGYDIGELDQPGDDPDGDGFTNFEEYAFGTAPDTPNGSLVRYPAR